MPDQDFIPKDDEGKAALFERFRTAIPVHAAALGLSAADTAGQAADAAWFRYILNRAIVTRNAGSQWTAYKKRVLERGGEATLPVDPPLPLPEPPAVAPGILARFRALVRRIKVAPGYTVAVGEALGIVSTEAADPDPATLAPRISLRITGGQVVVVWNKGKQEGVEIQKDSGNGWEYLAADTRPNFTDPTAFPAPPAVWKYRAIYTRDAQKLGQLSQVAAITVGG